MKQNSPFVEFEETDDLLQYPSVFMEKQFIDEYYLFIRRVKGAGLSLKEFWETDLFSFGQLYQNELEVIRYEEEERKKQELESKSSSRTGYMTTPKFDDSEDMVDIYESLIVD